MPRFLTSASALLLLSACGAAANGNSEAASATSSSDPIPVRAQSSVAPDQAAAVSPLPTPESAEMSFARQLAIMLVGHATLDGRDVTGVRAIDKCHTAFATVTGETIIDWTKAGNAAAQDDSGRENTQLPGADGEHMMSVEIGDLPEPAGNVANRSSGAFGQLALECAG